MRRGHAIIILSTAFLLFALCEVSVLTGILVGIGPYKNKYMSHDIIKCNRTIILETYIENYNSNLSQTETKICDCYSNDNTLNIIDVSARDTLLFFICGVVIPIVFAFATFFVYGYTYEKYY